MGSVVECPRCRKSVVVPPQSAPQAEQIYRMLKNKRIMETTTPPLAEDHTVSEPTVPESAWDELGGNVNEADLNQWIDELWTDAPENRIESFPISLPNTVSPSPAADTLTILSLQKRQKLITTLLYVSVTIAFFTGIVFGILVRGFYMPMTYSHPHAGASAHEITGTLYYLNENGERRADADAVIICLPKDRIPSPLLSCKGLRPQDDIDNDMVQQIIELGGMYERTDHHGSFTLQYREGVRYLAVFISSHQMQSDGVMKPSILKELRQYFYNPEFFGENVA